MIPVPEELSVRDTRPTAAAVVDAWSVAAGTTTAAAAAATGVAR